MEVLEMAGNSLFSSGGDWPAAAAERSPAESPLIWVAERPL